MDESNNHNGFKLIGIVPLKDCNQKFRKNLEVGIPYLFYNNYKVELNGDNSKINNITVNKSDVPNSIYNLENGIKINVSAVVGSNGSGKSALIELLYYFVYAISSMEETNEIILRKYSDIVNDKLIILAKDVDSFSIKKEDYKLGIQLQNIYNIQIHLKNDNSNYKNLLIQSLEDRKHVFENILKEAEDIDDLIQKQLNLALIYEVENQIYIVEFINGKLTYKNDKGQNIKDKFKFENFFYSINLNYSHHSLNSNIIGGWIDTLFHKNDGYRTPVVINPMRDEGVYDINKELNLTKERLMFNLSYYLIKSHNNGKEYKLLDKYNLKTINFSIKPSSYSYPMGFDKTGLNSLNCYFLIENFINEKNATEIKHLDISVGYLERKLEKIRRNYSSIIFKDYDTTKHNKEKYFQQFILKDNSHITKKIKQVVNYLKYVTNITSSETKSLVNLEVLESLSFTSKKFISFIKENMGLTLESEFASLNVLEIINYLPPSIFNIDFELSLGNKESILLSQLSSGEQQMIFNINTILYHLYNLQSSFLSINSRLVYKNVSIILDEIELYYHPEMQRQFLKNLLDSLELVEIKERSMERDGIESINICFLTHSPFILSDIPSQNILKLKEGKPESNNIVNSFAANIYDLLKDEFFLRDGTIGAFASNKISEILSKDIVEQEDIDIINLIGDPFLKGVIKKKIEEKLSDDLLNKEIERLQNIKQNRSTNATN